MSEIEKMKRYIERTKMKDTGTGVYKMNLCEAFALAHEANEPIVDMIALAFNYGKAKGYRAAKAERRSRA